MTRNDDEVRNDKTSNLLKPLKRMEIWDFNEQMNNMNPSFVVDIQQ